MRDVFLFIKKRILFYKLFLIVVKELSEFLIYQIMKIKRRLIISFYVSSPHPKTRETALGKERKGRYRKMKIIIIIRK